MRIKQEITTQNENLIINRLKSALKIKRDRQLAEAIGIATTTLAGWKNRGIANYEIIFSKCVENGLNIHYIITGEGPVKNEMSSINEQELNELTALQSKLIKEMERVRELEAELKKLNNLLAQFTDAKNAG